MTIIYEKDALSSTAINQITNLITDCNHYDKQDLSYPIEEMQRHYLYYDADILVGVIGVIVMDAETIECLCFTLSTQRRTGIFTQLLDLVEQDYEDFSILFRTTNCSDTTHTMLSLEAQLLQEDYLMKRPLTSNDLFTESTLTLSNENKDGVWNLLIEKEHVQIGSCMTSVVSKTTICLHHVEIHVNYQQNGYGTLLLKKLFGRLYTLGYHNIILHVEADNTAAVFLYKKTGFCITQTLSTYLY